jgi:hypothetical protein
VVALQRKQPPPFGDTRQQSFDDLSALRSFIDVIADGDDRTAIALRTRLNTGETLAEQIVSAMDVGDDVSQAHSAAGFPARYARVLFQSVPAINRRPVFAAVRRIDAAPAQV